MCFCLICVIILSPSFLQLHEENVQLFDHMNSLVDEVRQIEGAVVEISQLQRVFTEKVLEQVIDNFIDVVLEMVSKSL